MKASWCKWSPLAHRRHHRSAATAIAALGANAVLSGRLSTPGEVRVPAEAALVAGLLIEGLHGVGGICVSSRRYVLGLSGRWGGLGS